MIIVDSLLWGLNVFPSVYVTSLAVDVLNHRCISFDRLLLQVTYESMAEFPTDKVANPEPCHENTLSQ